MAVALRPDEPIYVTLAEAKAANGKIFMGKPCIHGHTCGRYVSSGDCIDCTSEYRRRTAAEKNAKRAAYRAENREAYLAGRKMDRDAVAAEVEKNKGTVTGDDVPPIRTRKQAAAMGLVTYTVCDPCQFNHPAERYVRDFGCVECARLNIIARRAASTVAANGATVVEGPPCRRCGGTERYASGPCVRCTKATAHAWYENNSERVAKTTRNWLARNPEKRRIYAKISALRNPEGRRANTRNRRARLRKAEGHHNAADILRIYKAQRGRCAMCRKPLRNKYHADHIIPTSKGGSNWPRNIQLLCSPCNLRKHAKDPLHFAREIGLLL